MVTDAEFVEFYGTHRDRLVATLHGSFADLDLCSSAVDEAMARAFARWSRVGRLAEPAAWVFVTARNAARKELKRSRRQRTTSLGDRVLVGDEVVGVDEPSDVWRLVAELPARQREAVGLRHLLGLTERGVGEVMGVRRGTVSSTLRDAYRTLGVALRDEPATEKSSRQHSRSNPASTNPEVQS